MEPEPDPTLLEVALGWLLFFGVQLVLLAAIVALGILLVRLIRAMTRLLSGDFAGARALWARWLGSWIPTLDSSARYNVAYCLHHEGKLEEALAALRALEARRPRTITRSLCESMVGATLLLLDRDHEEAGALVERGDAAFPTRQSWLWRAHAALSRGDRERAAELVEKAAALPDPPGFKLGITTVHVDKPLALATEAFLRGWYHERLGDLGAARPEYARAAATPRESVYVLRSRAALDRLAPVHSQENDEPPSSLSPVAMP
jgi:tetratricopeptide (TPR) repeat protein